MSLLFALFLAVAPARAAEPQLRSVDDVLAQFKNEPTVTEVQAMVLEYSKTDSHYVDAWLRAANGAAALPTLTLSYGYDTDYDNDYDYTDDYDLGAAEQERTDASAGVGQSVDVRASWDLDKLVMSSEKIRVISEAQDIVKLRDKALDSVTRLYFDRRRLQVEMLLGSGGDLKTQMKNELRLQELTAQLDAYTGGRFSKALGQK